MRRVRVPLVSRRLRWALVALVAAAILSVSVVPVPGEAARDVLGPSWDKQLHAVVYAGLALLVAYATADWRDAPYRRALAVILVTVCYGALVEVAQLAVPYRQFSPADLAANAAGALVVVGWFALEARVRYRRVDVPVPPVIGRPGREE